VAEVAILGTGRMGSAMAHRVADAGHDLTIWNRTEATARAVAAAAPEARIAVAPTPEAAVAGKTVVLTVLSDGDAGRTVLLNDAVLAALTPDAVVCDLGTSGMSAARDLARGVNDAGARFVDAPVSGSVPAVEAGSLLVMAGGNADAIAAAATVIGAFARRIVHVGEVGAGQAMKLAVNLVVHNLNAALAEALALATSAGITPAGVIAAPFVVYKRAAFLDPRAPVAMSLDLVNKDLHLITGLAEELGVHLPVTNAAVQAVTAACVAGLGRSDMASLGRFLMTQARSVSTRDGRS
jgi:3-hydroxyisobutyrate dehydrogenase-like beta-hydroxyacid dehydrogenase